jgi:hypothetical protein
MSRPILKSTLDHPIRPRPGSERRTRRRSHKLDHWRQDVDSTSEIYDNTCLDPKTHAAPSRALQEWMLTGRSWRHHSLEQPLSTATVPVLVYGRAADALVEHGQRFGRLHRDGNEDLSSAPSDVQSTEYWLGELFSCGYCLGHSSALALTAIYQVRIFHAWWPLDFFLTALVIAWLSAFQWITLCWLMKMNEK